MAFTLEQCWHAVPGGTAVAALGMAHELASRPEVELIGVAAHHSSAPALPFAPLVPVRQLPLPRRALYEAWRRLSWPAVQRATGPVDVVHATTIIVPPPGDAPMVVTVHDLAFVHEPSSFTRHGVKAFMAGLDRIRRDADLVLCSSQATLEDCLGVGLPSDRLRLVPLGLDPVVRPSAAEVEAVRVRLGLAEPYLLFVGTLEPRKNVDRLVAAVGSLSSQLPLVLVGPPGWGGDPAPGPDGASPVRRLGFVDEPTKAALYEGAEVVCYPSLREGFGFPVLEAMAHGAPVVTSRETATAEVGGDAVVLVDPVDPADIARGIVEARQRRAELAEAGPRRAARFTWAATADAVLAAYREVVR